MAGVVFSPARGAPVRAEDEKKGERAVGFSENVERLQPSATIAVDTLAKQLKAEGRDIINLGAGEPDFDTPQWICDAAVNGIRGGKTRYTPAAGIVDLRKAIAEDLRLQFDRTTDWAGVVVSNGAKHALFNACFSLFGPGDEVLVASPYWTSYPEIVTLARAEPVFVFGSEDRNFVLTPGDLDAAFSERTRGLILCSPSNPTGYVYSQEEFRSVAEWARDRGIWLISDEIYRYINFDDDAPATGILSLPAESVGPFVLIDGVSKAFAMTGWRIGFSYSTPDVAKKIAALQSHTTSNPSSPAQEAALAAYTQRDRARADVHEMVDAFRRRRNLVTDLFKEFLPELSYVKPSGAFYLYFRVDSLFREGMEDSGAVCKWLLEEAEIALVPGVAFGDQRYVRMSYATSDQLLEEAIRRLAKAVNGLPQR